MNDLLWNHEEPVADLGVEVPLWIDSEISGQDIATIIQGGCASGAYMPAVTYHQAAETMAKHGDDVLQFVEDHHGELPPVPQGESWSGIAVFYLSAAVEAWANEVENDVTELLEEQAAE